MCPRGVGMTEFNTEQPSSTPESFAGLRDSALEWIDRVGRDIEIDNLVLTPEGNRVWHKLMTKFVFEAPPEQRKESLIRWQKLHQPNINKDRGVLEKNLLLASMYNEVEEESSADGRYLRTMLASFNEAAHLDEDQAALRRVQFMGLWAVRQIETDFSS